MKSILFVCMGNICRSPAAEGVFKSMVSRAGREAEFDIDSAGTIGYHSGKRADSRMRAAASQRGYSLASRARRLEQSDFDNFDLIVAMDDDNYRDICDRRQGQAADVVRMCQYCTVRRESEVPDPYYGGSSGFEDVLDILEDACRGLLEQLPAKS